MVTRTEDGFDAYCRCPVVLRPDEIPPIMKAAITAVADKRYFDHGGIDIITLLSVLRGGFDRGGSTIPMQLLKNLVFHDLQQRDMLSRVERKSAELWHAGTFDGAVGKDALLAAYLNQIEFGGRDIVGLYRAARHYFRKEPKDLTLYEAAMLAGMVQAPARLNPLRNATRSRAHARAKLVLKLMAEQGKITDEERRRAIERGMRPGILPEFRIQPQAFTEWVVQKWGSEHVRLGETVRFFVTLDPRLQHLAERHVKDLVSEGSIPPEYEAALVAMEGSGRVRAMVGGLDWSQRQFNSAIKAQVQPGSTAKLPLVVAACEAGRRPESRIVDLPVTTDWPANGAVGYRGETTLKEAIASSRNAAAVRLAKELGVPAVAEVSRRLGIDPGPGPDLSFVLGTFSTSPLAVTAAYAAIANGGYRAVPIGVLAAVDGRGEVRASYLDAQRTRVVAQKCVEPTRRILREVVQEGTGRGARPRRGMAYGKTGTTTSNADAWFVGWAKNRVLGIWMGRQRTAEGGVTLAGSGAPADLFRRIQNAADALDEQRRPSGEGPSVASSGRRPAILSNQTSAHAKTGSGRPSRTSQVPLPPMRPGLTGRAFPGAGSGTPVTSSPRPPDRG
jgi:penicillin-binding protein 1A